MIQSDPRALLAIILINGILALSQSIVLRAGVFSVATTGLAAIGAYASGFLVTKAGWSPWFAAVAAIACSVLISAILALPISRLRGIYAAIATLAFVIVVQTTAINLTPVTGGAAGLSGIPQFITWRGLLLVTFGCVIFLMVLNRTSLGIHFNVVRQDEKVAASQGVSAARVHFAAFLLSGVLAGLGGVCLAYYSYAVFPESFDFILVTNVLTFVFLGGFRSWRGPLVGTAIIILLPEFFRPLAEQRLVLNGLILILVVLLMPKGIVDALEWRVRWRRDVRTEAGDS